MGVLDLLLNSEYDEEMYYLRSLSNAKLIAANWFNHGRMMRPLELKLNTSHGDASAVGLVRHPRQSKRSYDHSQHEHENQSELDSRFSELGWGTVMATAWQDPSNSSLLVTLTATKRATSIFSLQASLDLAEYGFGVGSHGKRFVVQEIVVGPDATSDHEWRHVGSFDGERVELQMALGVRAVSLLRIQATE